MNWLGTWPSETKDWSDGSLLLSGQWSSLSNCIKSSDSSKGHWWLWLVMKSASDEISSLMFGTIWYELINLDDNPQEYKLNANAAIADWGSFILTFLWTVMGSFNALPKYPIITNIYLSLKVESLNNKDNKNRAHSGTYHAWLWGRLRRWCTELPITGPRVKKKKEVIFFKVSCVVVFSKSSMFKSLHANITYQKLYWCIYIICSFCFD